jgi:hypothetical protein
MDCKTLQGVILGNVNYLTSRWILTALNANPEDFSPGMLIVVTGADNYSEIMLVL